MTIHNKQGVFGVGSALFLAAVFFSGCSDDSISSVQVDQLQTDQPLVSTEEPESSSSEMDAGIPSSSSDSALTSSDCAPESSSSGNLALSSSVELTPDFSETGGGVFHLSVPDSIIKIKGVERIEGTCWLNYDGALPPYGLYEDPECVIDTLTSGLFKSLMNQGLDSGTAKQKALERLFSVFYIDSLLRDNNIQQSSIGYVLSYLVPSRDTTSDYRQKFIEKLARGEEFDDSYRCASYQSVKSEDVYYLPFAIVPLGGVYSKYQVDEPNLILSNLWRRCGNLPICNKSNEGLLQKFQCSSEVAPCIEDGKDYVCGESGWEVPTVTYYETHNEECNENNRRVPSDSVKGAFYVCYEGKWYISNENQVGNLPQDYFFNENVEYGLMIDPRDGKKYRTVIYKGQEWMAQNIDYSSEADSLSKGSMCHTSIGCEYGRFYTQAASKHACPEGWRLPTETDVSDWTSANYSEAEELMPKLFSSLSGSRGVSTASNESGLSLLAMTYVDSYGWDASTSFYAHFWLSSGKFVRVADFFAYTSDIDSRENGEYLPVRCIKD